MLIKTENLSSKSVINFYLPNNTATAKSMLLFVSSADCKNDFVQEIFSMSGVIYCLLAENLISIKYADSSDKEAIKALALACIDDYIQGLPDFDGGCDDLSLKCEALANALIRPTLNRDNGDIVMSLLSENILQVQFTGHCAGCPYAQNTLQNVIVKTFKHYLPQINEVRLKE
ncbi:MAG: NifU family protein [Alphaproteobacteria bacterium]|nr:NifU family protein [Alphaproteobacteria bacterium]